ncbi:MAG: tetratricopeptide repeat protein [Candidatus Aureabacteria bacterium]|nr:tetratricopeptide repeat protein [Candidatus Auribacterota bacterium]
MKKSNSNFNPALPEGEDIHSLYQSGKYEEVLYVSDFILAVKPDDIQTLNYKGIALDNLKRHEEAISCFDQAISIHPKCLNYWINKSIALSALKRYEEAIASCRKGVESDPQIAEDRKKLTLRMILDDLRAKHYLPAETEKPAGLTKPLSKEQTSGFMTKLLVFLLVFLIIRLFHYFFDSR